MNGFEFCRALLESSATRNIPILAITGNSEYLDDPERFRHAGISHVLIKPCELDEVVREVRRMLEAQGPRVSPAAP